MLSKVVDEEGVFGNGVANQGRTGWIGGGGEGTESGRFRYRSAAAGGMHGTRIYVSLRFCPIYDIYLYKKANRPIPIAHTLTVRRVCMTPDITFLRRVSQ